MSASIKVLIEIKPRLELGWTLRTNGKRLEDTVKDHSCSCMCVSTFDRAKVF